MNIKQILKISPLVLPILLFIIFVVNTGIHRSRIDRKMQDADGLVWKGDNGQYIVHVETEQTVEFEQVQYNIKVTRPDGEIAYNNSLVVDSDMFGGGFVKSLQVDNGPVPEVVAWGAHESKRSFVLHFSEGTVKETPFAIVSPEVKTLAGNWHKYNVMKSLETGFLLIILIGYYILYGIVWRILRIFRGEKGLKLKKNDG